jgi:hypothetical protein
MRNAAHRPPAMHWIRSGLQSLSNWFAPGAPASARSAGQLDAIRAAMLEALGDAGAAARPGLAARIRFSRETETLWVLRAELMTVSSRLYGESHAGKELARISAMFDGLLPHAWGASRRRDRRSAAPWRHH